MKLVPPSVNHKIEERQGKNALRSLPEHSVLIDFSSNDYLGFAQSNTLFDRVHNYLIENNIKHIGATGSRLLSGNHHLYAIVEDELCTSFKTDAALIFNSGYDANIGIFSSVPQRQDVILYDELAHASIRDGIQLSKAKSFKFKHNDLKHLKKLLEQNRRDNSAIYVVTESVFSMDGDSPNLEKMCALCRAYSAFLIVDEAHALGVIGDQGKGLVAHLNLENEVFARLITFGKALGCHGAAILGPRELIDYLVNFARSFIYTTALPPHTLASIKITLSELLNHAEAVRQNLRDNMKLFKSEILKLELETYFLDSASAIQSCIVPGNDNIKALALVFQSNGFDVKPILSPTVPKDKERLRFCIHSHNSKSEIQAVIKLLAENIL